MYLCAKVPDDTLLYSGFAINGGAGTDTLIFKNVDSINLSGITNITNIEKMDLSGNGNQTLGGLSLQQIFDMSGSGSTRTLTIDGDSGDELSTVTKTGWTKNSEATAGGYTSYTYHNDVTPANTLTLKVDTDLTNTTNLH